MQKNNENLVWVDLEMTGLDPEVDTVIEIATIVTDAQLKPLAEGPVLAVHTSDEVLEAMDEWNTSHHNASGLVARVRASEHTLKSAADATISFLSDWIEPGKSPMCGNSICQDRRFLVKHMPALEAFFHYRNVDVSTIKELVKRWNPQILNGFKKNSTHLAMDDIRESIAELEYYRKEVFRI
jgi:oligoribonuclease